VVPTPSLPEVNKVEKPVENVKPSPVIPAPSLPEVKKEDNKKDNVTEVKPSVLSFAGVQFKTSDGFVLDENTVGTPTSLGLVIDHNGHQHFVYYKQLVNSKFEKLIPQKYLEQAKKEYKELEDKVTEKINYLTSKNNIDKNTIKYVSTAKGDALSYNGTTTLLDEINSDNNVATQPKETPKAENKQPESKNETYSEEVTKKINHLAKILGINPKLIKLVETENGQALTYPHGDHSHTVLLNAIHVDETEVNITDEIQKQINYIAEVYGVPKEAVKVTKDFFVFNEPAHAYDPTHIHPYLIPRDKFHIPEVTGDDEVDFENELLALSKRTGIPADKIKRDGDKFVIPHGDHDHFVKILSKGADIYYKNRIPNITGTYVAGDFDKEAVFKHIDELKANNIAKHSNDKKQANRVNRALDQLRATIEELPTNSTKGYLEMLDNFDKKYIQEETNADTSKNDEFVKKYNTLLNRIKDNDIEKYNLSKVELTNELNIASENKDVNTLNKINHLLDELQKFEDRESITTVSYIKYFLENIDSDKIDNKLREELSSLVKDSYESQAFITRTPMRTLVTRLINAKNALHYALEHNTSTQPEFGENYNKLNIKDEDGITLRSSADQFAKEANDPSFPLEFSKANYD
ncbi:MAG: pneumococcal-type histidine triad protein, partial [Gemella haemolysans]|nr:pneumococcal-type histidine triad protein [Gemella haemolysans]